MTFAPNSRFIEYEELEEMFEDLPREIKMKFNDDEGAYAASMGYDGIIRCGSRGGAYTVVLNRSAIIIREGTTMQSKEDLEVYRDNFLREHSND